MPRVADDPAFSTQPFIQADSVKIGVELLPLIFSKQIRIRGFSLLSPKVQLLRAANGTWNYSTIGKSGASTAQDADTKQAFPDLTVGHVTVENGRFTVGTQPAAGAPAGAPSRVYDQVNLEVKDFGFRNSFPFTVSAHLPGGWDSQPERKGGAHQPAGCIRNALLRTSGDEAYRSAGSRVCGCLGRRHGPGGQHGSRCQLEWAADACGQVAGG